MRNRVLLAGQRLRVHNLVGFFGFIFTLIVLLNCFALAQDRCAKVDSLRRAAAEIRGLSLDKSPACWNASRDELITFTKRLYNLGRWTKNLAAESKVFKLLGFIPDDYDYENCIFGGMVDEIAALYAWRFKKLIIADWVDVPDAYIVHELTHAIQDKYYPGVVREDQSGSIHHWSDRDLAHSILIEGDAMWVESEYLTRNNIEERSPASGKESNSPDKNCVLPKGLKDLLLAPYDYGLFFVNEVRKQGGQKQLDNFFLSPPNSTRTVLHVAHKDLLGEAGRISIPTLSRPSSKDAAGLKIQLSDSLGELFIRTYLKLWLSPQTATLAAAGLKSDRLAYYKASNSALLIWNSAWDSEKNSKQFYLALREILHIRTGLHPPDSIDYFLGQSEDVGEFSLKRDGMLVSLRLQKPA